MIIPAAFGGTSYFCCIHHLHLVLSTRNFFPSPVATGNFLVHTASVNFVDTLLYMYADKGDGTDAELGGQEEDFFIQDEIFKSRLASIKRVSSLISTLRLTFC